MSADDEIFDDPPLTERQREVHALLAEGLQTKVIATRLGISYATARHHVQAIMQRLGVANRKALWRTESAAPPEPERFEWRPAWCALGLPVAAPVPTRTTHTPTEGDSPQ